MKTCFQAFHWFFFQGRMGMVVSLLSVPFHLFCLYSLVIPSAVSNCLWNRKVCLIHVPYFFLQFFLGGGGGISIFKLSHLFLFNVIKFPNAVNKVIKNMTINLSSLIGWTSFHTDSTKHTRYAYTKCTDAWLFARFSLNNCHLIP